MVAIILAAPLVAAFDDRYHETGLPIPLLGIAALGVFLAVPDTEGAMVLLGVAGIAGFLGWPRPVATLGAAGSYAVVGLYMFVAAGGALGLGTESVVKPIYQQILAGNPWSARVTCPAWIERPMPTPPPWWMDTQVAPLAVVNIALSKGQSAMASEPSSSPSVSR